MFHYPRVILKVGPRILATYFFHIKKWARHPRRYPMELKSSKMRTLTRHIAKAFRVDFHVFGLENIPKDEKFFLVSNHMSAFDVILFLSVVEGPLSFVGKKELAKVPFIGNALKAIEALCIERDNLRQSLKKMLALEEDMKKKNKNWMIFPEGTRIRDPLLPVAPFHHGTFRPAHKTGTTILPAACYGSFRVLKNRPQFKRYPVFVTFLKPIRKEEYENLNTADLAEITRTMIQREVTYHLRPLDHEIMSKNREKKYRFNWIG